MLHNTYAKEPPKKCITAYVGFVTPSGIVSLAVIPINVS